MFELGLCQLLVKVRWGKDEEGKFCDGKDTVQVYISSINEHEDWNSAIGFPSSVNVYHCLRLLFFPVFYHYGLPVTG